MTADYKQCTGKQPKLAVGCIRPYIQWVSGMFIRDQNGRRVKLTTRLHLMARLRLHTTPKTSLWLHGLIKCSRYRPGVAQRVGRGIALLFHDRDTRRG